MIRCATAAPFTALLDSTRQRWGIRHVATMNADAPTQLRLACAPSLLAAIPLLVGARSDRRNRCSRKFLSRARVRQAPGAVMAFGSQIHSDNEKFCCDLNRPKSCEMSEWPIKTLRKLADFQAEYEGSIPFTRSNHL